MNASSNSLFVSTPKSVELLSKRLKTKIIDSLTLETLIELAIRYWQKQEISKDEWESTVSSSYLPVTTFEELFSGILNLTLAVLRIPENKLSLENIHAELVSLGLPDENADQIIRCKATIKPNVPNFLKLVDNKWRIDVTISSSSVSRVLEPSILMELNFASGDNKIINIPISQFHNLRFQVASCINKLNHLSI